MAGASSYRHDHFQSFDNHRAAEGDLPRRNLRGFHEYRPETRQWNLYCSCGAEWEMWRLPRPFVWCPACGYRHRLPGEDDGR